MGKGAIAVGFGVRNKGKGGTPGWGHFLSCLVGTRFVTGELWKKSRSRRDPAMVVVFSHDDLL